MMVCMTIWLMVCGCMTGGTRDDAVDDMRVGVYDGMNDGMTGCMNDGMYDSRNARCD